MLLIITIVAMPLQTYAAYRITSALKRLTDWPRKRINLGAMMVGLWLFAYPFLMLGSYRLEVGWLPMALQRSDTTLDLLVTYPFWIGLILAVELFGLFLLLDIAQMVCFPVYQKHKPRWLKLHSWIVLMVAAAAVSYAIIRVYKDTFTLRVRSSDLTISELPAELDGLRIVEIADLQADSRTNGPLLQRFVETVNALTPDLIVFAGDLVTSGTDYIDTGAATLGELKATHGVYACLGDHDHFSDRDLVAGSLKRSGIQVLDNESIIVPIGSSRISLTGITNVYRTRPSAGALEKQENQRSKSPLNIMLTHQPSPWLVDFASAHGYDLFLAGHTHGGQIAFPLPGLRLCGSRFETKYVSGFYRAGGMTVSVTNGVGLTLAPIRYNAPAEITSIVLRSGT
jgi:uncharacterized protein